MKNSASNPSLLEFLGAARAAGDPLNALVWTILVVSDDEVAAYRLSRFLGCRVKSVIVQTCLEAEAVAMATTLPFDIVICYRATVEEVDVALQTLRLRQVTAAPVFWLSATTVQKTLGLDSFESDAAERD